MIFLKLLLANTLSLASANCPDLTGLYALVQGSDAKVRSNTQYMDQEGLSGNTIYQGWNLEIKNIDADTIGYRSDYGDKTQPMTPYWSPIHLLNVEKKNEKLSFSCTPNSVILTWEQKAHSKTTGGWWTIYPELPIPIPGRRKKETVNYEALKEVFGFTQSANGDLVYERFDSRTGKTEQSLFQKIR